MCGPLALGEVNLTPFPNGVVHVIDSVLMPK